MKKNKEIELDGTFIMNTGFMIAALVLGFFGSITGDYFYDKFVKGEVIKDETVALCCIVIFLASIYAFYREMISLNKKWQKKK